MITVFKKYDYRKVLIFIVSLVLAIVMMSKLTSADPVISQGYNTTQDLSPGSIVSIKANTNNYVEFANLTNSNSLVGVVIDNNNAQVSLTSGSNQVQVATSGVNLVLVSNINGNIVAGSEITSSPINGVGMLATSDSEIIGDAQANFPNSSASKQVITNSAGVKQTVEIGSVPVLVSVGYYSKQPSKTIIPSVIQNLANALAGKPVKTLPIIVSGVIFLLTLIVVVAIIYSLIHGSIISVGRNPLSQSAVYRNVLQMSALVVGIIGVAIFAIFMILTKLS